MQVSISGQAVVFVVRATGWSLTSRAGVLTYAAFFGAQVCLLVAISCCCPLPSSILHGLQAAIVNAVLHYTCR